VLGTQPASENGTTRHEASEAACWQARRSEGAKPPESLEQLREGSLELEVPASRPCPNLEELLSFLDPGPGNPAFTRPQCGGGSGAGGARGGR